MNASYQDRVLSEDALKHVFQCEYDRLVASADSMAGALRLTRDAARLLVDRLGAAGLVTTEGGAVHLTVSGREYALQILRAHRLYETFLARETGLGSGEWHLRAEVDEHKLTPAHVDALAQRLGNPRYDPHGDPIPTSTGELPPARGRALSEWPPGVEARIVHVEDEPASIYSKIVDLGLMPGMRIVVDGVSGDGVLVRSEGRSLVLPRTVAGNVSVTESDQAPMAEVPTRRLADLKQGEISEIRGLSPAIRGRERNRLLDLGFVPGSPVELGFESPLASPSAYRVRGSLIALRREQAEQVYISPSLSGVGEKEIS
jgi:DtxR family Mn-dependent transcriptional regulator